MKPFSYTRPKSVENAIRALSANPRAFVLAGGTNLVDLMKYDVVHPEAIIDINRLPLKDIEECPMAG